MAKKTANKDNHVCITQKDLNDYDNKPTKAKARKIEGAAEECKYCRDLVIRWQNNN